MQVSGTAFLVMIVLLTLSSHAINLKIVPTMFCFIIPTVGSYTSGDLPLSVNAMPSPLVMQGMKGWEGVADGGTFAAS